MNVVSDVNFQTSPEEAQAAMPAVKTRCRLCTLFDKLLKSYMEYKAAELQRIYDFSKTEEGEDTGL